MEQGLRQSGSNQVARDGNRTVALEAGLSEKMDMVLNHMMGLEKHMKQRMDKLERKVAVMNHNAVFRGMNRNATLPHSELAPLHSILTGQEIEDFPRTAIQVKRLPTSRVDELLCHLGHVVEGTPDQRKRHLKYAMGLETYNAAWDWD
ncbi:hypothetical protein E4U55_008165 [Claviceps digitariae]|nr:hypothetical protein E4U55_008165 [Claviceps digitariae]